MPIRMTLLLAALGLLAGAAPAQSPAPPGPPVSDDSFTWLKESEAAYTAAQATAWRDEMMPAVAAAAGREFTRTPDVLLVPRGQFVAAMVEDALARAADLILMDLHMPGIDGLMAARIIKEDPETAHVSVVAVTADELVTPGDLEAAGIAEALLKPVTLRAFAEMLGRQIPA